MEIDELEGTGVGDGGMVGEGESEGEVKDEGGIGAEARAAAALAEELRKLPGVAAEMVRGETVEEVKRSVEEARRVYEEVRAQVMREAGTRVPGGRATGVARPAPKTAVEMIERGLEKGGG